MNTRKARLRKSLITQLAKLRTRHTELFKAAKYPQMHACGQKTIALLDQITREFPEWNESETDARAMSKEISKAEDQISYLETAGTAADRHDERCPNCGRFVERNADGFYDRLDRDNECSEVREFCNESCANEHHKKR